jgi:hypothetical protein
MDEAKQILDVCPYTACLGKKLQAKNKEIQEELDWWRALLKGHHDNKKCPSLRAYVENLQAENKRLLARYGSGLCTDCFTLGGGIICIELAHENKRLQEQDLQVKEDINGKQSV